MIRSRIGEPVDGAVRNSTHEVKGEEQGGKCLRIKGVENNGISTEGRELIRMHLTQNFKGSKNASCQVPSVKTISHSKGSREASVIGNSKGLKRGGRRSPPVWVRGKNDADDAAWRGKRASSYAEDRRSKYQQNLQQGKLKQQRKEEEKT